MGSWAMGSAGGALECWTGPVRQRSILRVLTLCFFVLSFYSEFRNESCICLELIFFHFFFFFNFTEIIVAKENKACGFHLQLLWTSSASIWPLPPSPVLREQGSLPKLGDAAATSFFAFSASNKAEHVSQRHTDSEKTLA